MKILLIDNYDSFTYNLYHYISFLKCNVEIFRNDKINIKGIDKKKYKKIVISPGPGNPNQAGNFLKIVKHFYKSIPVFKSKIVGAKKLMHGKTSIIRHEGKGLFNGIKNPMIGTRYHSLIIDRKTLGKDLIITAETKDNIIMGVMHKKYNIHGVQFHPESIKTIEGMKLLKNFINS